MEGKNEKLNSVQGNIENITQIIVLSPNMTSINWKIRKKHNSFIDGIVFLNYDTSFNPTAAPKIIKINKILLQSFDSP